MQQRQRLCLLMVWGVTAASLQVMEIGENTIYIPSHLHFLLYPIGFGHLIIHTMLLMQATRFRDVWVSIARHCPLVFFLIHCMIRLPAFCFLFYCGASGKNFLHRVFCFQFIFCLTDWNALLLKPFV